MTETGRAGCYPPASDEGANDRRRSRTEYFRRYRQANRDKIAEQGRLYREANREKIAERKRLYHQANRDKINRINARYKKALVLARAGIPLLQKRGHLNSQWQGGRFVTCSFPECNRNAGWRCPCHFKNNKYGFLCSEHRYAYRTLKKLKEEYHV